MAPRTAAVSVCLCKWMIAAFAVQLFIGCAPSIRYTRNQGDSADSSPHYLVPRDWDYRKSYKVPQTRLLEVINAYIGTRYKYGGTDGNGVDCSGFVCLVFKKVNHAKLPHSSRKMKRIGKRVTLQTARTGDLVFFRGSLGYVNHVGIYIGDNKFAHASSGQGVIYSCFDEPYYKKHFMEIRRIF